MHADNPIARRTVLKAAAAGFGLAVPALRALAADPMPFFRRHHLPLGLQLYTVGAQARKDLNGTLARVAAACRLRMDVAGAAAAEFQALLNNPRPANFYAALGERLADRRKYFNAERAFLTLHNARRDALARGREDLVARYTAEMAEVVESTSYAEVIANIRKELG